MYVAHDVAAGRHVALVGFRFGDVDDLVEEVGFAVLAAEVLGMMSTTYHIEDTRKVAIPC
jgi:hypothetical protein